MEVLRRVVAAAARGGGREYLCGGGRARVERERERD